MDPYCPYGSPLSWIPIVLDPYCPGSLMSWFHFVLDTSCPGSILSWIHLVLVPYCPGSLLSWIHLVLDPSCPGSLLSWFLFCPVSSPGNSMASSNAGLLESRSEMSALTRKHRPRTWAMECHWQRTIFQGGGPKIKIIIGRQN